jgi:hypothetical protein
MTSLLSLRHRRKQPPDRVERATLDEHADRGPVVKPHDGTRGRVRRHRGDAGHPQGRGVGHPDVPPALNEDGMAGARRVQLLRRRQPAFAQVGLMPAARGDDPLARRRPVRGSPQRRHQLIDRPCLLQRYVIKVARRQQLMVVRVVERRIQHQLRIVDHRRARADEGVELVPGPSDRADPAVLDRNRLIDTAVSGHPVRAADPEHNVGQIVWRTGHIPNLAGRLPGLDRDTDGLVLHDWPCPRPAEMGVPFMPSTCTPSLNGDR